MSNGNKEDEDEVSSFEDDVQSQSSSYSGRNEVQTPQGTPKARVSLNKRFSNTSFVMEQDQDEFSENLKTNNDVEKLNRKLEVLKSYLILERKQRVIDKNKVVNVLKQFDNLKKNYFERVRKNGLKLGNTS